MELNGSIRFVIVVSCICFMIWGGGGEVRLSFLLVVFVKLVEKIVFLGVLVLSGCDI